MESGGADISSQHPRPLSNSLDNGEDLMEEEVRAPIAPRQETLMGDDDFGFGIRGVLVHVPLRDGCVFSNLQCKSWNGQGAA